MKNEPSLLGVVSQSLNRNCLKGVDVFLIASCSVKNFAFFSPFSDKCFSLFPFFPLVFFAGSESSFVQVSCFYLV